MQETDAAGHPRVNSYLKHFTAYSTETNRMHSDYNVTVRLTVGGCHLHLHRLTYKWCNCLVRVDNVN